MQNLPIITNPSDVSVYKFERKSIFRYLRQIEELFEKETGSKELGLFLAEPLENDFNKKISWSTKAEGPIRNMSQLSPGEKDYVASKVQEYSDEIKRIANKLEANNSASSFISADILNNLLITRELPEALFLVGNQVIITEWGCAPYGRYDRKNFELTKQIKKIVPEYVEPEPVVLPKSIVSPDPVTAGSNTKSVVEEDSAGVRGDFLNTSDSGVVAPPVADQSSGFSLWRWLVILLLLALLIFGLSLKGCSKFNQADNGAEETALRSEINSLWVKVKEKAQACLPNKPEVQGSNQQPQIPTNPIPPLNLDQKNPEVFKGKWQLMTNLYNTRTNEKVVIEFDFGADGRGEAVLRQPKGDCHSAARVNIQSNRKFTVFANQFSCPVGAGLRMSGDDKVSCNVRADLQKADCNLICASGACTGVFQKK